MQKISNVPNFPFLGNGIKYYEATGSRIVEIASKAAIKDAYLRAKNGESNIYATWHGKHGTDMFFIDDLHKLGLAFGFERSEHEHGIIWKIRDPQEKGVYVTVDIEFACGCTFDTDDGIRRLKQELLLCKGWEMSESGGRGGHGGKYNVRIKRNTIK